MAKRIHAITAYRPRIVQGKAMDERQYIEKVSLRTTLSPGVVRNVQESEIEALVGFLLDGRPIHTGFAIYTLDIGLDGSLTVNVKLNKRIEREVNTPGAFRGTIVNAENIGKSSNELVALWNEDHPDEQIPV